MVRIIGPGRELFDALKDAGLADGETRRVVLDIHSDRPVIAYIEKYADERVLKVFSALEGVEISREEVS